MMSPDRARGPTSDKQFSNSAPRPTKYSSSLSYFHPTHNEPCQAGDRSKRRKRPDSSTSPQHSNMSQTITHEIRSIHSPSSSEFEELPVAVYDEDQVSLEGHLRRQFTIDDAIRVTSSIYSRNDEESHDREISILERVYSHESAHGDLDLPPDGGYGWICCACASVVFFCTWGSNSAFGVYLAYYINNESFPGASKMDFAWIAGLIVLFGLVLAPLVLAIDKMIGIKPTMTIGVILHFVGYMLASFATKLWHLYITQGVIIGIAFAFAFVPVTSVIPQWFLRRRSIAMGLMATGTGIGGLFYALTVNAMIQKTGDQRWSLRFLAVSTAVLLSTATVFVKHRVEPSRLKFSIGTVLGVLRTMFNRKVLKKSKLWIIIGWLVFTNLGYSVAIYSYATAARSLGLSQHQASVLTAVINTAQAFGRPTTGFIADMFVGRVNYTMIMNLVTMTLIFAFWMQAQSFAALLICGICLGLFSGVGSVMNAVFIADAFLPEEFACAWAMLNIVQGTVILFSEVISIGLVNYDLENPFLYSEIITGMFYVIGFLFLIPFREYRVRKVLQKKRNESSIHEKEKNHLKSDQFITINELETGAPHYESLLAKTSTSYLRRSIFPIKV